MAAPGRGPLRTLPSGILCLVPPLLRKVQWSEGYSLLQGSKVQGKVPEGDP